MKHWERYFKWWLGAAAVLGLLIAGSTWSVHRYREWKVAQRVDRFLPQITQNAEKWGLPLPLVRSVVRAESGGNPAARSEVDARGLMQVLPTTKDDVRGRFNLPDGDLFDPDYNLLIGTAYLRHLMDRFDSDPHLVVAAYHMGPTRVASHRRANPRLSGPQLVEQFAGKKTKAYVRNVLSHAEG